MKGLLFIDLQANDRDQFVVVDHIKELFNVQVHDPLISFVEIFQSSLDGLMGASTFSESKTAVTERGIKYRIKYLIRSLLDDPVYERCHDLLPK